MRVLVATWGWPSHFYPLVPLAWALRLAGHEVRVAGQPSLVGTIASAGLPAVAVGPDLDFATVFGGKVGRVGTRASRATPAGGTDGPTRAGGARRTSTADGDGDGGGEAIEAAITADGGVVRYAGAMLEELVAFARLFRPDLVLHDPFNFAATLAAAALRVPAVRALWGPDAGTELALDEDAVIGPLAARLGLTADGLPDLAGALTLDPCPPALQVPLAGPSHPVRHIPYNGRAEVPRWLWEAPAAGRVCVTWGTMMAGLGLPDRVGLRRVIEAVAKLDVEVVAAVHPSRHERLHGLPPNVRPVWPPLALHLAVRRCGALVHQGGCGTLMTGLAYGVPQLVLPQVSDQHFNAERLAAAGAGTWLAAEDATEDTIRDVVTDLLAPGDHHGWRAAARRMRRQIEGRPTPAEVVPVLERLASTGVPS